MKIINIKVKSKANQLINNYANWISNYIQLIYKYQHINKYCNTIDHTKKIE